MRVLRIGSWIGGDRDGNPFVTGETLRDAFRLQADHALRHYLEEVHALGGELSMSTRAVPVSARIEAMSDASPHRRDEPYRRVLIGIYARLTATLRDLISGASAPRAAAPAQAYGDPAEFLDDLNLIDASLRANQAEATAKGRLLRLRRKIGSFGFHLATVDLRQNSELHMAERELVELYRENGIRLRLFHERGGGSVREAILAQPAGAVDGQVRLTDQGEVISSHYSQTDIGHSHMETVLAATVEASLFTPPIRTVGPGRADHGDAFADRFRNLSRPRP